MKSRQNTSDSPHLKRFFGSIRLRLLLWGELILLSVLVAFSITVYYRQVEDQKFTLLSSAVPEVLSILEAYQVSYAEASGEAGLQLSAVFPELQLDGHQKPLFIGKGSIVQSFLNDGRFLIVTSPNGLAIDWIGSLSESDIGKLETIELQDEIRGIPYTKVTLSGSESGQKSTEYLVLRASTPLSGTRAIAILVGTAFDPYGQLSSLALTLILTAFIVLGISLVGGYWLSGRMMQPVQDITRMAQEIHANDLTRRLSLRKNDELGELADTFDRMLDRLEDAFQRQRQFTADASHDLRTPLTIINLEVNRILQNRLTQAELQKSVEVIRGENEHMTHLVNNLLVLAHSDAGTAGLTLQTVDLSEIALEVVERLIPLAQRNGMEIYTGEMSPVLIHGDHFYLNQMVTNLVQNAIQYGRGAERKIWIETGCGESSGLQPETRLRQGWLRVEDHGPGIPEEHIPHLFYRFYRVDPARAAAPEENGTSNEELYAPTYGHGLGLSIVQWVARIHGGDVRVTTQVGEGATFEVSIPCVEGDAEGTTTQ
jgi:signal transduction histidine kinase